MDSKDRERSRDKSGAEEVELKLGARVRGGVRPGDSGVDEAVFIFDC